MDVREVVRFKKGVGGIEPPNNIGILMDRAKEGKEHVGIIFTIKGKIRIKWSSIGDPTGHIYDGDKKDEACMRKFILSYIEDERKGLHLSLDPRQITERYSIKILHKKIMDHIRSGGKRGDRIEEIPSYCIGTGFTPAEIGSILFSPSILSPKQVSAVASLLSECDDGGKPYFHRLDTDGKTMYFPFTEEAIKGIRKHIDVLDELRRSFVEWIEETDPEKERVLRKAKPRFSDPKEAELDDHLEKELERICDWAVSFMSTGTWKFKGDNRFGLGGTPVTSIDRFDLQNFIFDLSHYMIGSVKRDLASDLTGMLLKLERISLREASEMVVEFNLGSGRRSFHQEFSEHVRMAAKRLPEEVKEDEKQGRKDLRYLETYTIDPPDAKDFDDAISIEKDGEDTVLWVHIADVSHYVRPGDLIDGEARYRGTSVYLPTGVLPMLPEELSENLCSLKEKVDRLAVSTKMVIGKDMGIKEHIHFRSVIRVDANLSYDQVEKWIDSEKDPFISLFDLSRGLEGYHERLRLETPERRVRFPQENEISVTIKRPTKATGMIEQFMVLTNEVAARTLRDNDLPLPYRVHPLPDRESIRKFNDIMRGLDFNLSLEIIEIEDSDEDIEEGDGGGSLVDTLLAGGKISIGGMAFVPDDREGKEQGSGTGEEGAGTSVIPIETIKKTISSYNRSLTRIDEEFSDGLSDLLRILVLRTMPRAFYSTENIGHFGLASDCYCHFTSPIRRYPDVLVHRAITNRIGNEENEAPDEEEIEDILEHVNDMSDQAEEWEREMVDVALATRIFMSDEMRAGTKEGYVSSLTPTSVYISLSDGVTEGSIPVRTLSPLRLYIDDTESRILATIEGIKEMDPDDPLIKRIIDNGGEDIEILRIGDRRHFSIHSVSIALGRIGLSIQD